MKKRAGQKWKELVSVGLVFAMLLGAVPVSTFAEQVESTQETEADSGTEATGEQEMTEGAGQTEGLCEHHPAHTAECGYVEGTEGSPCTYECGICVPDGETGQEPGGSGDADTPGMPPSGGEEPGGPENAGGQKPGGSGDADTPGMPPSGGEEPGVTGKPAGEQPPSDGAAGQPEDAERDDTESLSTMDTPDWITQWENYKNSGAVPAAPTLTDGAVESMGYGLMDVEISEEELSRMQTASAAERLVKDPAKQIPGNQFNVANFIYINGEAYKGQDVTVTEGDSFSYMFSWAPNPDNMGNKRWEDGSWFELTLFQVPGLNLKKTVSSVLLINGINVGQWELNYDVKTGEMKYTIVFNKYIRLFDPATMLAFLEGNGSFLASGNGGTIVHGGDTSKLEVEPRPKPPTVPSTPSGVGWQPSKAPTFNDRIYAFGKGVKWQSSGYPGFVPQIEWRVVFLDELQKKQQAFVEGTAPQASTGYCVIEDTLDENQRFYVPGSTAEEAHEKKKYKNDAPFFIEIPVLIPQTGHILNGGVGRTEYDSAGEIYPIITGEYFTEIDGSQALTAEAVNEVQGEVRNTPLTWTVTTDPDTRQQTLLINTGILGGTDPNNGITWDMIDRATSSGWPGKIDSLIAECDAKINAIENGTDSPISLLDTRRNYLSNKLNAAINLPQNAADKAAMQQEADAWNADYRRWREDQRVNVLSPLVNQFGTLIVPLPKADMVEGMADWTVDAKGTKLGNTQEYLNYLKSLEHLATDQDIYLNKRLQYGADWELTKKFYQNTKAFYADGSIHGFAVKVRSTAVNLSMDTFENTAAVSVGDKKFNAQDESNVTFSSGAMGNYALGSAVLQKADSHYDTGDTLGDIANVQAAGAGLAGAEFQMYTGDDPDNPPPLEEDHLAHFLDRDASENGDTYYYTHSGAHAPGDFAEGDIDTLVTDADGKIVINNLTAMAGSYWLVETKAPVGYYLNGTPVQVHSDIGSVTYDVLPNVARSVRLNKVDSYSGTAIEGAEFALYTVENGVETPVNGFVRKEVNGLSAIWKTADDSGREKLVTDETGKLCIHGLDAGDYVLRETVPAPGYEAQTPAWEVEFTLETELPAKDSGNYDSEYHLVLPAKGDVVENDPGTADLEIFKKSRTPDAYLEGAAFALFRFAGTEAEWRENPNDTDKWKVITPGDSSSQYFQTANTVQDTELPGLWGEFQKLPAMVTDENGALNLTDIPVGHYSIAELKAPDGYERGARSYYFDVGADNIGGDIQLYDNLGQNAGPVEGNIVYNYQKMAQLALVKYDQANTPPAVTGSTEYDGGYKYDGAQIEKGKGLPGATYKLFLSLGSDEEPNPDPEELKSTEILGSTNGNFDICLGVGTTDADGVLRLADMKDSVGNKVFADGLNLEYYYLIEVEAPDGYLPDREPVTFPLTKDTFPEAAGGGLDYEGTPGLIKTHANRKADYGIGLVKIDASTKDDAEPAALANVGFTVQEAGGNALLKFTGTPGSYRVSSAPDAVDTVYTGADGELTITGLKRATDYDLTETDPPQGYKKPDAPVRIRTVDLPGDGKVIGSTLFPENDRVVENERLEGKVIVYKRDEESMEPLSGAEFELWRTEVTVIPPDDPDYDPDFPQGTRSEDILVDTVTTGADGIAEFSGLAWEPFYFVRESKAPEGYLTDETKLQFAIDASSFDADGNPVPVVFEGVTNSIGTLGEAVLYKVDEDDPTERLPNAHFYLEKQKFDEQGNEVWIGYGHGIYITDGEGKINFLLPPGRYKLTEMAAPEGYLLPENLEGDIYFNIEKPLYGDVPEKVEITAPNRKGGTGLIIQKTAELSVPVEGVTFRLYRGLNVYEELNFVEMERGYYVYTADPNTPNATRDLTTDEEGMVRVTFPQEFADAYTNLDLARWLYYEEISAPANLEIEPGKTAVGDLKTGLYSMEKVDNKLSRAAKDSMSISIVKTEGVSRLPLPGAEFELREYVDFGDGFIFETPVATGVTDEYGRLTFNKDNVPVGLKVGMTYHLVETRAPEGFVLDEAHYEIILDERCFDEDFNFIPVERHLPNYHIEGSVRLTKTDSADPDKKLEGAEFELFHRSDDADASWEHYGEWRYTTDENGQLLIENLPYGDYKIIERASPLGYVLENPVEIEFRIEQNGDQIDLGEVANDPFAGAVADVSVEKVDVTDASLRLPGAKFQLYYLGDDGNYYLRHSKVYETDGNGTFAIRNVPVGSYALKEIEAPEGYRLPTRDMTLFSVTEQGGDVQVRIANVKKEDPKPPVDPNEPNDPNDPNEPEDPNLPGGGEHGNGGGDIGGGEHGNGGGNPGGGDHSGGGEPVDATVTDAAETLRDRAPQTGDGTNLAGWLLLMLLSAVGFAGTLLQSGGRHERKRRRGV